MKAKNLTEVRKALGNKCQVCGNTQKLQVHHLRYDLDDVKLLCTRHHLEAHHKTPGGKRVGVYLNAKLYDLVKASPSAIIQQALKEYEKKQEQPENQ